MLRGLRTAGAFLTRVPLHPADGRVDVAAAVPWFPVVGAVVGLAAGGLYAVVANNVAPLPAAALAYALGVMVTGAFHQDGLADVADAFGGGWDREQRLRILKDSRHGTYGVMSLVVVAAVSVTSLGACPPAWGAAGLVAAHTLGRGGILAALLLGPPATGEGLGAEYARVARRGPLVVGMGGALAVGTLALGPWVVVAAVAGALGVVAVVVLARRKIGGLTGDVLGTAEQAVEAIVLVVTAAVAAHVADPWWW